MSDVAQTQAKKPNTALVVFAWIGSIFILFGGVIMLFTASLSFPFYLLAGLIINPPFYYWLKSKWKFLNRWVGIGVCILSFFLGATVASATTPELTQEELIAQNNPELSIEGFDEDGKLDTDTLSLKIYAKMGSSIFVNDEKVESKTIFSNVWEYSKTFDAGKHTLVVKAVNNGVEDKIEYTFQIPQEVKDEIVAKREAEEKQRKEEEARQARKDQIEDQFSGWDGSHRELVKKVKLRMNDPDSFEHVDTRYWDDGKSDEFRVKMTFRGKNAFGGTVTNVATADIGVDGETVKIVEII